MIIKSFYYTHVGNYRAINEDSLLVDDKLFQTKGMNTYSTKIITSNSPIFAIADGMGGHDKGELASQTILKYLLENKNSIYTKNDLNYSILNSQKKLNEIAKINNSYGMGTTLSGILFLKNQGIIFNCGDSRVYQIESDKLTRITEDDTEVFSMYKNGEITEDQIRLQKGKNILTSALIGDVKERIPKISYQKVKFKIGSKFLLCSDGLWEGIPLEKFQSFFREILTEEEICKSLAQFSLKYSGLDNISFILLKVIDI
jgi:serine/threonine protein phosphatase PrpC